MFVSNKTEFVSHSDVISKPKRRPFKHQAANPN